MPDFRTYFDAKYLGSFHLVDEHGTKRDVIVTIESVHAEQIVGENGRADKRPVVKFKGKDLPMIFNRTNCKTVAAIYGKDTKDWLGKRITLYATVTQVGGVEKDCIRVKPTPPAESAKKEAAA